MTLALFMQFRSNRSFQFAPPTGCQQVTDCWPTVGPHFSQHFGLKHNANCWPSVGWQLANCRPTVYFGNYSSLLPHFFAQVLHLNCTAFSQSESSNFFHVYTVLLACYDHHLTVYTYQHGLEQSIMPLAQLKVRTVTHIINIDRASLICIFKHEHTHLT